MSNPNQTVEAFQEKLLALGYDNEVMQLDESTRTAEEAAEAIGCDIDQIVKSIVFRLENSGEALLILVSGVHQVDEEKVSAFIGDQLKKADADFVKEKTGYVIGGVPPVGHTTEIKTLIDEKLITYESIWAAAGHPKAVFHLDGEELLRITHGEIVPVSK